MPTDKNRNSTDHPEIETEHSTSSEQSQSRHENNILPEKQAAEAMKTIRKLQRSIFTGGRKFTREEMNER